MENLISFEEICKVKGYDPEKVIPDMSSYPERHMKALTSVAKLFIVNEAINYVDNGNKDWVPDWQDDNQEKHYPWVDMEKDENNPTGFRLCAVIYDCTISSVGSRLVYRSPKGVKHAFTHFEDLYRDLMVLG